MSSALPTKRQTLLFSATMPDAIKQLARKYQQDPVHIKTIVHVEDREIAPGPTHGRVDWGRRF